MSHKNITYLCNAYDLQADPYEDDKINCQEVVNYCEARFRVALQSMIHAIDADLAWMTMTLFRELELCFSYIGVATGMGQSVTIPIIIRSLGHDFYRFGLKPGILFRPGVDLLTYIDGNLSSYGVDDPNLLVTEFLLPWWSGPRGSIKHTTYLSFSTLTAALGEHRKHLASAGDTGSSRNPDFTAQLNKPLYSWHPEVNADLENPCTRCRLYRAITFGVLDRLRDAENLSQGMAMANSAEADIGMRRASGFYELYEHVVKKEVEMEQRPGSAAGSGSDPGATLTQRRRKGKSKAKKGKEKAEVSERVERVRTEAEKRLRDSCARDSSGPVESKWTWGVDLNSQDIWDIARGADKHFQIPHSGYDGTLRTGKLRASSPIRGPEDIENEKDPDLLFDELTYDQSMRDLLPHEVPLAFAFQTLHYAGDGETHPGLHLPPTSGSEYVANSDGEQATNRERECAMPDEVNRPEITPQGSPPHRPWLGPPPPGYMGLPPTPPVTVSKNIIAMRAASLSVHAGYNLETRFEPTQSPEPAAEPESESFHMDVDVASSNGSDGGYGLVAPAFPDDSDEDIDVGNLGRNTSELRMRGEDIEIGTYGLVAPDSPSDSDEEIPVGNLGLVSPTQIDSGSEIEVGNLGLDSVDSGMAAEDDPDEEDSDVRARSQVRIPLPQVNPETGQYTADSFANIPQEWLD